jgi:hypothetical protein
MSLSFYGKIRKFSNNPKWTTGPLAEGPSLNCAVGMGKFGNNRHRRT